MDMTEYEKRVLAATPAKALTFLRAAATKVEIRAALFSAGYSTEEQELGWTLLQRASGYVPGVASQSDDTRARAALAEIDAWDEPGFRRINAALLRLHPDQHAFVFSGLESARGAGSVLGVSTLLDRLDQLENADERAATREADRAAIATLASRGITAEVRQHLRELIATAQTAAPPVFPSDPSVQDRDQALLELRAWYKDWSETARAVIRRKDYLVMLGLSKRRANRGEPEEVDETEVDEPEAPVDPVPVGPAPVGAAPTTPVEPPAPATTPGTGVPAQEAAAS